MDQSVVLNGRELGCLQRDCWNVQRFSCFNKLWAYTYWKHILNYLAVSESFSAFFLAMPSVCI